jgi:hypothetical protein
VIEDVGTLVVDTTDAYGMHGLATVAPAAAVVGVVRILVNGQTPVFETSSPDLI